jgi:hypothetical protein
MRGRAARFLGRVIAAALCLSAVAAAQERKPDIPPAAVLDAAFARMYNFDFPGAFAILKDLERRDPAYAPTYGVRAAALLFSELYRMRILETEFFANNDNLTDVKLPADPKVRAALFAATAEARKRGSARLAADPADRDAMFAMCMATGVETDYTILVEKKYFRSFSLSKESQAYAHKLLALNPPVYDAYLTLGSVEYTVGSMNFFFRLFVHFDQIKGSKQVGMENLRKVIAGGRYYPPFAKILLSVMYIREKQPEMALPLLTDLSHAYPENPVLRNEAARVAQLVERARANKRR